MLGLGLSFFFSFDHGSDHEVLKRPIFVWSPLALNLPVSLVQKPLLAGFRPFLGDGGLGDLRTGSSSHVESRVLVFSILVFPSSRFLDRALNQRIILARPPTPVFVPPPDVDTHDSFRSPCYLSLLDRNDFFPPLRWFYCGRLGKRREHNYHARGWESICAVSIRRGRPAKIALILCFLSSSFIRAAVSRRTLL